MERIILHRIYTDFEGVEVFKVDRTTFLFKKKYINSEEKEAKASLKLLIEGGKVDVMPGKTEQKDECEDRLPLWNCIADLIKIATEFKNRLDNGNL